MSLVPRLVRVVRVARRVLLRVGQVRFDLAGVLVVPPRPGDDAGRLVPAVDDGDGALVVCGADGQRGNLPDVRAEDVGGVLDAGRARRVGVPGQLVGKLREGRERAAVLGGVEVDGVAEDREVAGQR